MFQGFLNIVVAGSFAQQPVDEHGAVLAIPVQPLIRLAVLLEIPCQTKPAYVMPSILKIEPVCT